MTTTMTPATKTAIRNQLPQLRPEWGDAKTINRVFDLCRTTLYRLADEGKIKTASLRDRGKLRGKRLYSMDSIAAFIESRATGGAND